MPRFKPGESGNPAGRPVGSKDRRNELRGIFQSRSEELIDTAITLAISGDVQALRMCLDRICPPLRPQGEPTVIPTTGTWTERAEQIYAAATAGGIAPDAADNLMSLLLAMAKVVDLDTVKTDIAAIKVALAAAGHEIKGR